VKVISHDVLILPHFTQLKGSSALGIAAAFRADGASDSVLDDSFTKRVSVPQGYGVVAFTSGEQFATFGLRYVWFLKFGRQGNIQNILCLMFRLCVCDK